LKNAVTYLKAFWADLGDRKMSDAELEDSIQKGHYALNPYTREPFIIEDSPGNITVERKDGLITGIILYHQSGSPYRILLKK
jgi:hypothetical protein